MSDFTAQELSELSAELDMLDEEFSEMNSLFNNQLFAAESGSSEELSALNQELEGSGIEGVGTSGQLSLLSMVDEDISSQSLEMQGIFSGVKNFVKNKAAKIIRKIIALVRKYSKLKACIPAVTKAVAYFKSGKYLKAVRSGYSAYSCIRARL